MRKRGFTLIESMAVLIILGILAMILIPLVNDIITSSRKKVFRETVNNLLEASNIYEAGYLMDNGKEIEYPVFITCNGETCEDVDGNKLDFKGSVPISGRIIIESSELKRAELISNGMLCGSGTKGNIEVREYCSLLDHTNPIIDEENTNLVEISSTTNSVIVAIPEGLMYDEESEINRYDITIYEGTNKIETKTYEEPNIIFYNLKNNTEYRIEITGINGNKLKTTIERSVSTLDIINASIAYTNEPTNAVNGYFKSQVLNVNFNGDGISNPEYYIRSGRSAITNNNVIARCGNGIEPADCEEMSGIYLDANTWYKAEGNISVTYNETSSTTSELTALVYDGVNYGGADTKTVAKTDQTKPTVSATVSGKTISISKSDAHSGVSSYCVITTDDSGSCDWTQDTESSAEWNVSQSGTHYIFVKDGVGNVSDSVEVSIPATAFCEYTKDTRAFSQVNPGIHSFTVPEGCTGVYKLEVYGAQGGNAGSYSGGNGGYAYGNMILTEGTTLYAVVGGAGSSLGPGSAAKSGGGYNGGGFATGGKDGGTGGAIYAGGGGGASQIAKSGSLLRNTPKADLYLVAGGGGGAAHYVNADQGFQKAAGGSGGGATGGYGSASSFGGTYGQGGNVDYNWGAGGGGGYTGGTGTACGSAGGGTGYVNTSSFIANTTGMQNGQKSGNGAVYITFKNAMYTIIFDANGGSVSTTSKIISPDSDIMGDMPIPTRSGYTFWGWYADPSYRTLVTPETHVIDDMHLYARWTEEDYITLDYTGSIQAVYILKSGTYKLEVWGAQGSNSSNGHSGAAGGYSSGEIYLTSGSSLFIGVGGSNSYNGGGGSTSCIAQWGDVTTGGVGGGATHIATTNRGTLSNYNSYRGEVLIVAGGGGGAGGNDTASAPTAGNNTSGLYQFGQGQTSIQHTWSDNPRGKVSHGGGGGGWLGGASSSSSSDWAGNGGNGGSGYIGGVTDGVMQAGVRSGNGTAKITFISE